MSSIGKTILREMREMVRVDRGSGDEQLSPFQSGLIYFGNEEFEEAIAAFRRANELTPDFAFSHYYLARCLRRLGRYAEAITSFERSIELNPVHAPSHAYLGDVFLRENKLPEAGESFRRAIYLQCDNLIALRGLTKLTQRNNGDLNEIAELLKAAYFNGAHDPTLMMELLSFKGPDTELCLRLADELSAQRSHQRALFFYRLALREESENKSVRAKIQETLTSLSLLKEQG